jgi:hypothetical protein
VLEADEIEPRDACRGILARQRQELHQTLAEVCIGFTRDPLACSGRLPGAEGALEIRERHRAAHPERERRASYGPSPMRCETRRQEARCGERQLHGGAFQTIGHAISLVRVAAPQSSSRCAAPKPGRRRRVR